MIYLDNAATSFPKAPGVPEAVFDFLKNVGANYGRSSHSAARKAGSIVFETRENLAQFFGMQDDSNIIFTANATEALNLAILGMVKPGEVVLTSSMEHNSVMRPLRYLEATGNVKILQFKSDKTGFPDLTDFEEQLKKSPCHLIFTACSNVNGVIFPFQQMALKAKETGANIILDASQIVGVLPFNFADSAFEVVCFPGHKSLLGPTGTGALLMKENTAIRPLKFGGTGSRSDLEFQPDFRPDKYESGTLNIAGLAGLNESLKFILKTGIENIRARKKIISDLLLKELSGISGINILSPLGNQIGVISITSDEMNISDLTYELDKRDVAVRMGLHCAPAAHKTLGTFEQGGTVRFSPGYFTTEAEILEVVKIMREILPK
ncbi:MAG: aminotransferase class V-fold PLP-dependent enzyme [Candidatus Cloacimonadales bacterium]|nr:aminotransferase class V-fold PLP-dependent enzyme [Candidatus Cloacimonadales bacterium]